MPKLVVLSESLSGRSYELSAEKTTIGRLDDNAFILPEPSVSSHHCEIVLQGDAVLIKDLNSTNGTFINGEKIGEGTLKPGQTLRLGQLELKLDTPVAAAAAADKKRQGHGGAAPQGVKLDDLDKAGKPVAFDKNSPFAKKKDKTNLVFIAVSAVLGLVIIAILVFAFIQMGGQ